MRWSTVCTFQSCCWFCFVNSGSAHHLWLYVGVQMALISIQCLWEKQFAIHVSMKNTATLLCVCQLRSIQIFTLCSYDVRGIMCQMLCTVSDGSGEADCVHYSKCPAKVKTRHSGCVQTQTGIYCCCDDYEHCNTRLLPTSSASTFRRDLSSSVVAYTLLTVFTFLSFRT